MKKLFFAIMMVLFANSVNVFAEEELYFEDTVGLPETYITSEMQIMSVEDEFVERIRQGWDNLASEINVSDLGINLSNYKEYYEKARHNSPLYYYIDNSYRISYNRNTGNVTNIFPSYTETDITVIQNTISQIEAAADEILFYIDDNMTDFEKVMTVHDYMVLNYSYDTTLKNHSITIMTTKTGVCESYTYAFMYMMNKLGIEAKYVSSEAMTHAWNLVKLDGEWYHIDLTWDDPTEDVFAQVRHTYALLSTDRISGLPQRHYGFDTGELIADSTVYDDAVWHDNTGSIVSLDGVCYWVSGDDLVNENGDIIRKNLDGGDGLWNINLLSGFRNTVYTGLAEYNGKLYFNTDTAIYSYNPHTQETELVKMELGVCGLYIDKNDLRYCEYSILLQTIYNAGKIHLGDVKIAAPCIKDDKVVAKVFKEASDEDIQVFSFGKNGCHVETISDEGVTTVSFDAEETQTLFFWDSNMKPLKEKEVINMH